jgi:signal transduction histidine kinase
VTLLALIGLGLPLALSIEERVDLEVRGRADSNARIVATGALRFVDDPGNPNLERLVREAAATVNGRVIVTDRRGRVIGDSAVPPNIGANYSSRPEIRQALAGRAVQEERQSKTLNESILATAEPIRRGTQAVGAVRVTQSIQAIENSVSRSLLGLGALALLVFAFALMVGWLLATRISRPITELEEAAAAFASGGGEQVEVPLEGSREQRSLALSFNEMTARVERLLALQEEFVADASHQLRTPLTGVRLRLENLSEEMARGGRPDAGEVEAAMEELDRLSNIVDQLLVLSRAGEYDVPGETLDLAELVRETGSRWSSSLPGGQIEVSGLDDPDSPPGTVFCARSDFEGVMDVLIENAAAYSPEGAVIEIRARPGEVSVLDRGAGIARGEEEAVFERFSRGTAGSRVPGGSGLGLAIAREMMAPWDATVSLGQREGGGTEARVRFPSRP